MSSPLRLLLVEDSQDDTELLIRTLNRAGYEPDYERVESEKAMSSALGRRRWDIVIVDYSMPQFSGYAAIKLLNEHDCDVPCIMVSGCVNDDLGTIAMKSGAHDYLMKDNLERLGAVIERELREATDRREHQLTKEALLRNREQLLLAQRIQEKLFPHSGPQLPDFDIEGASYPAEATSGDYYDFVPLLDGTCGIVIADVSSHGFGPALLMAETRAYLRALAETHVDAVQMLKRANNLLVQDTTSNHFVTLFFAKLNPQERVFEYASAGHRGYHMDVSGHVTYLESTGLVLGLISDVNYELAPLMKLELGELVLLMTDGIAETSSIDGVLFGVERTLEVVRMHRAQGSRTIVKELYKAALEFGGGQPQMDDITAVVIRAE